MRLQCLLTQQLCHVITKNNSVWPSQKKKKWVPLFNAYMCFLSITNLQISSGLARFFVTAIYIFLMPTMAIFLFKYIFYTEYICNHLFCNPSVTGDSNVSFRLLQTRLTTWPLWSPRSIIHLTIFHPSRRSPLTLRLSPTFFSGDFTNSLFIQWQGNSP